MSDVRVLMKSENDLQLVINLDANTAIDGVYVNPNHGLSNHMVIEQLENLITETEPTFVVEQVDYVTNQKIISNYDDVVEHFKPSNTKYFVTGVGGSKFNLIEQYFKKSDIGRIVNNGVNYEKKIGDINNAVILSNAEEEISPNVRTGIRLKVPNTNIVAMIISETENYKEYVLYLDTTQPIKYIDLGGDLATFSYQRTHENYKDSGQLNLFNGIIEEPKIISDVFIDRGINSVFEKINRLKMAKNINDIEKTGLGFFKINKKGFDFKNNK